MSSFLNPLQITGRLSQREPLSCIRILLQPEGLPQLSPAQRAGIKDSFNIHQP
jgi:hypothetical protein